MNSYLKIAEHYSQAFEKHGATPKGLDWDNQENLDKRYRVMYELIKHSFDNQSLLDFGCGFGGFYNWLSENSGINYHGIDINPDVIKIAQKIHHEAEFYQFDIHKSAPEYWYRVRNYDYIICNGTFTVKNTLTQEEMTNFMCSTLEKLWTKTNKGIAFNCMSKVLDFERDDLFHVSFDQLSQWVYDNLSSKFLIRQDYGLREFTMYVYK